MRWMRLQMQKLLPTWESQAGEAQKLQKKVLIFINLEFWWREYDFLSSISKQRRNWPTLFSSAWQVSFYANLNHMAVLCNIKILFDVFYLMHSLLNTGIYPLFLKSFQYKKNSISIKSFNEYCKRPWYPIDPSFYHNKLQRKKISWSFQNN